MKKVAEWNRPEARRVTEEVNKALAEVGKELGINIVRKGNGTYDDSTFTFKVECALIGADGGVKSKTAEDFKKYATMYGLKPTDFGRTFKTRDGKEFTICGLNTKASKNTIHAKNVKGATFVFPSEQVKKHLERIDA